MKKWVVFASLLVVLVLFSGCTQPTGQASLSNSETKLTCPYECCENNPTYLNKTCPENQECTDQECIETAEVLKEDNGTKNEEGNNNVDSETLNKNEENENNPETEVVDNLTDTVDATLDTQESCTVGYLDEFRCNQNNVERAYQYTDCSKSWQHAWHCAYGCENAKCKSCYDSDGGKDYYTKGYIDYGTEGKREDECQGSYLVENYCDVADEDYCADFDSLEYEHYCDMSESKLEYYLCPNSCDNGACKQEQDCKEGYVNEYQCSGDWSQKKYQYSDCSFDWVMYEACIHGCGANGQCQSTSPCTIGIKCKDDFHYGYQKADCSWDSEISGYCPNGCTNGECNSTAAENDGSGGGAGSGSGGGYAVSEVSDGDTIKLSNGEFVRLIGIDAPEAGEPCYSESKEELANLILGRAVELESDVSDRDKYGRLLRYIYIEGLFINKEMVSRGYAFSYPYEPDTSFSYLFESAENEAEQNERGCLWQHPNEQYIEDSCIQITLFHYDAAGNDNYNLNDEYVQFKNSCNYLIDMSGWTVKDGSSNPEHLYTLSSFSLNSQAYLTLYTGQGANNSTRLYWNRTPGDYAAIWNNSGDTLYLRNAEGKLVLNYSYVGG